MPQTLSKALFSRLLRSDALKRYLRELHLLTGMDCILLDELGSERLAEPRRTEVTFRRLCNHHPELNSRVQQFRQARLAEKPVPPGTLGFDELIHPLRVEDETAGYLVLSGFRDEHMNPADTRAEWSTLAGRGLQLPWREWEEALNQLPIYNAEQQNAWRHCLRLYMRDILARVQTATVTLDTRGLPPLVLKACDIVRATYAAPIRLNTIAADCGVSPEHLSRQFHHTTGLRFQDYVAETRIAAACRELADTDRRISDIAGSCGFSTLSRFNRCFKQLTGTTPRDWRKRARLRNHPPPTSVTPLQRAPSLHT